MQPAAAVLDEYARTPFDAPHAGLVTTGEERPLSAEQARDTVGLDRTPLDPDPDPDE